MAERDAEAMARGQIADMPVSRGAEPAPFARMEARAGRACACFAGRVTTG